jgi:hypothetical protein
MDKRDETLKKAWLILGAIAQQGPKEILRLDKDWFGALSLLINNGFAKQSGIKITATDLGRDSYLSLSEKHKLNYLKPRPVNRKTD